MAKCLGCGARIGALGRKGVDIYDGKVCLQCVSSWGFTPEEISSEKYRKRDVSFLSKGKAVVDAAAEKLKYIQEHTKQKRFRIYGEGVNKDGEKIKKLLAELPKEQLDDDQLYHGFTNKQLKEYGQWDHPYYIYEGITLDCDLKLEDDTVRVYLDDHHIGDLPEAKRILTKHEDYACDIMIMGGKYKMVECEDDTTRIKTGTDDWYAIVQLEWVDD